MSQQPPKPLQYGRAPESAGRQWLRIFVGVIIGLALIPLVVGGTVRGCDQLRLLREESRKREIGRTMRSCMAYQGLRDRVVLEELPGDAKVKPAAGEGHFVGRSMVAPAKVATTLVYYRPPTWAALQRLHWPEAGADDTKAVLFLGSPRVCGGGGLLVLTADEIGYSVAGYDRTVAIRSCWYSANQMFPLDPAAGAMAKIHFAIPLAQSDKLRLFEAYVDPQQPRILIPYELNGVRGQFAVDLTPGGGVTFTPPAGAIRTGDGWIYCRPN